MFLSTTTLYQSSTPTVTSSAAGSTPSSSIVEPVVLLSLTFENVTVSSILSFSGRSYIISAIAFAAEVDKTKVKIIRVVDSAPLYQGEKGQGNTRRLQTANVDVQSSITTETADKANLLAISLKNKNAADLVLTHLKGSDPVTYSTVKVTATISVANVSAEKSSASNDSLFSLITNPIFGALVGALFISLCVIVYLRSRRENNSPVSSQPSNSRRGRKIGERTSRHVPPISNDEENAAFAFTGMNPMLAVAKNEKRTIPSSHVSLHSSHTMNHAPHVHMHSNHNDYSIPHDDSRKDDRERHAKVVKSVFDATPIYSLQESWTSTGNQSHFHNPSPHLDSSSRQRHELSLRKDAKKLFDEHELPPHWSWDEADDGEVYYIDHEGETTWDDPRENFEDFFKFYVKSLNA
jgi:hypothetical protein